jgi:hypothetical protein
MGGAEKRTAVLAASEFRELDEDVQQLMPGRLDWPIRLSVKLEER